MQLRLSDDSVSAPPEIGSQVMRHHIGPCWLACGSRDHTWSLCLPRQPLNAELSLQPWILSKVNKNGQWARTSVVQHLPGNCEILSSISGTKKENVDLNSNFQTYYFFFLQTYCFLRQGLTYVVQNGFESSIAQVGSNLPPCPASKFYLS